MTNTTCTPSFSTLLLLLLFSLSLSTPSLALRNYFYTSVYTIPYNSICPSFSSSSSSTLSTSNLTSTCSLQHYAYFFVTRAVDASRTSSSSCYRPCASFRAVCADTCTSAIKPRRRADCVRSTPSSAALLRSCSAACDAARVKCFRGCFANAKCPVAAAFALDWQAVVQGKCQAPCQGRGKDVDNDVHKLKNQGSVDNKDRTRAAAIYELLGVGSGVGLSVA